MPGTEPTCGICGEPHGELPDIGSAAPWHWEDAYDGREDCLLTEDLCRIENRDYFIRGVLQVPILGTEESFGWGVWLSQSKAHFEEYRENFDTAGIGPFAGYLSTNIDFYELETVNLVARARFRGDGQRPLIELAPCEHPLFLAQRDGITLDAAWDIVHWYMARE